jgi:hypothetical protein
VAFSKDRNSSVVFVHFWGALQHEKFNEGKDNGNVLKVSRLNFGRLILPQPFGKDYFADTLKALRLSGLQKPHKKTRRSGFSNCWQSAFCQFRPAALRLHGPTMKRATRYTM